jgi:hypothetical protein
MNARRLLVAWLAGSVLVASLSGSVGEAAPKGGNLRWCIRAHEFWAMTHVGLSDGPGMVAIWILCR